MTTTHRLETTLPSQRDIRLAREGYQILNEHTHSKLILQVTTNGQKNLQVKIPTAALDLLLRILAEMSEGHTVTLMPSDAELSTQEAADILNVSRPYLVHLLEAGKIPFRKVGSHRRVLTQDIMRYKIDETEARHRTLDELSQQAQLLKIGY